MCIYRDARNRRRRYHAARSGQRDGDLVGPERRDLRPGERKLHVERGRSSSTEDGRIPRGARQVLRAEGVQSDG
jgi:hypothetical protein